ncbi:MAG: hypothetical protein FJ398_00010 [Verrucomicrobia bacterium]|nr:hypothetical protein [Verrucomicrobiota bacterium]
MERGEKEPDGRASLSPASRVGCVPRTSSGSLRSTRPTAFTGNVSPRCSVWNAAKKKFAGSTAFKYGHGHNRNSAISCMIIDRIREKIRGNFKPFTLSLSDGRSFLVPHPEHIAVGARVLVLIIEGD